MSQTEDEKALTWDLDEVLTDLKFGSYQIRNLCLIGLIIMFSNIYPLSFTLTAGDVDYRCYIPGCDNPDISKAEYTQSWLSNAVPFNDEKPRKCKRYRPVHELYNVTNCTDDSFDENTQESCNTWVFASTERTIVQDFDVTCENNRWELSMIGTINNVGQFFGIPLFGLVSDKYGRKTVFVACCIMSAIFGILRGFSTSYLMFAAFEFLDSFFGSAIYGAAFILGIELVNPSMRPLAATIIGVFYPFGAVIMGLVGWYFQDWRKLLLVCYTPGLLFISYYWLIPESIRWLQTHDRPDEVFKVLKNISKANNVQLPDNVFELEKKREQKKDIVKEEKTKPFYASLVQAVQSRKIFFTLLNCSFSWFSTTLVYYGLSINSVELVGNKYLNFILANAVEVPAFIISGFIMNKYKRRTSQCVSFFLSGFACIVCEFIPPGMPALQVIVYLISKFLITTSFNIIYIYSAEMFPTELRLSLCGFASMFGRIGSMIAPQTVLLRDVVGKHAPVLSFGVISVIAGCLATLFPETSNKKLQDTVTQSKLEKN